MRRPGRLQLRQVRRRARPVTRGRRRRSPGPAAVDEAGSPKPRRSWLLALAAAFLLSLTAYAFHYLDSLPQAIAVDPRIAWRAEAGRDMRLEGVAPGSVLAFDLRGPAAASLSFGKGARLEPDPDLPPGLGLAGGAHLYAAADENVSLAVTLTGGGGRGILHIASGLYGDEYQWLRLSSQGAGLSLDLGAIPGTREQAHSYIGLGSAEAPVQSARVTLPAGASVQLRLAVADSGRLKAEPAHPERGMDGFPLRALETGRGGGSGFERLSMACGASPGTLLWRRPLPAIRSGDCADGHLAVTAFALDKGAAAAALEGSGFVVTDGRTNLWQGFREFRQNDVVKTALGFLLASLVGWAFVRLRGGGSAGEGRRRTR